MNLAVAVRALRYGVKDAGKRLGAGLYAVDPLGNMGPEENSDLKRIPIEPLQSLVSRHHLIQVDSCFYWDEDGWAPAQDLIALLALLRDRDPKAALEIGTYSGATTRMMAINLPNGVIHTVDLPLEKEYSETRDNGPLPKDDYHLITSRRVGHEFLKDKSINNIVQHFGDTAEWDFKEVADATFFFIDGSHTYEYARNDTLKCMAVSKGRRATIVWHDCDEGHRGVTRWLAEMVAEGHPVKRIKGTNLAVMDRA
jgi:hypothetical protein